MANAQRASQHPDNLDVYRKQMKKVNDLRKGYTDMSGNYVAGFNEMAMATGRFGVETVKTISATERLSKSISDQKLTLGQAYRSLNTFKEGWREQIALQKAFGIQWTGGMTGKNQTDMYMPKNLGTDLDNARVKYGYINQAIGSIGTQTVNWGKNTQWAGRQIMVGIGVPVAIAAAGMAKLAYDADVQLTRLARVYDTTVNQQLSADDQAIAKQNELRQLRADSMKDARRMASTYGASVTDTLQLEADLAATGQKGIQLRQATAEVTRISTLGELDHATALEMTTALMSTYNMNAKDLTETFNYMNQIENSTSLQTKDFAEGIPRAASAMKSLGVDVKQMGILLVAMKAGGVDAAEGANALKSATARLLKPTHDAIALFSDMDISIQAVAKQAGGNLFKILSTIGPAMAKFAPQQRQAAMAALFGTYQFNRLNVATDGLTQALAGNADESDQVKRAMDAAGMSAEELAATASSEMSQLSNSMSNKFKRAVETLKADFISLGESLLPVLTWGVEKVSELVKWFMDLPGPVKAVATAMAAVGLAAGPIIMLLGLFGNLFGNLLKMGSWFGNLVLRFKVMDKAQRAEELMARRAASAFDSETSSVAKLTMELQTMIASMDAATAANSKLAASLATPTAPPAVTTPFVGGKGKKKGGRGPNAGLPTPPAAAATAGVASAAAAANTASIATNAEKAKLSFGKVVGYMGLFGIGAFALSGMLDSSGGLVSNLMNAAMFAAMLAGTGALGGAAKLAKTIGGHISKIPGPVAAIKLGWGKVTSLMSAGKGHVTGFVSGLKGGAGIMRNLIPLLARAFGPVGLLAVGLPVLTAIVVHLENARHRQDKINASTSDWADILGYVEQSWGNIQDEEGNASKANPYQKRADDAEKLKNANEELAGALKDAASEGGNFGKVYSLAMGEALKAKMTGASADQAKEVFLTALQAAGLDSATISNLRIRFDTVDLDNASDVANQIATQINTNLKSIDMGDIESSWVRDLTYLVGFGGDSNGNDPVISQAAEDAGKAAGQQFALGMANAPTKDAREAMATNLSEQMKTAFAGTFTELAGDSDISDAIKKAGITNMQDLYEAYKKANTLLQSGVDPKDMNPLYKALVQSEDVGQYMQNYEGIWDAMMGEIQKTLGLTDGDMKKLKESGFDVGKMLSLLNGILPGVEGGLDGTGDAASDAAPKIRNFADAIAAANNMRPNLDGQQVVQAMESAFSGAQGVVTSQADKLWGRYVQGITDGQSRAAERTQKGLDARGKREDKYWDGRLQALEDAQNAEEKVFKKSWDDREKGLDDQIKREKDVADAKIETINKEIETLTAADDERQKLFDREKTRIDRMAQLHNNNVDFNAALNSGNLDEAAKIYSSNSSQTQQWSIEDQQASLAEQLDKRKKVLQESITTIEAERDARVAALEAQKEALREVRQIEEEAFQKRQEQAKRDIETQREVAREKLQADTEAARRSAANQAAYTARVYEDKKTKLDMEIATIKATVPKTVEEYNNQVAQIEAKYQEYGVRLQDYGDSWSGIIGIGLQNNIATAAAALQNGIAWKSIGQYISDSITSGTGINIDQLRTFLQTGVFPEEVIGQRTPWNPNLINMGGGKYRYVGKSGVGGGTTFAHTGGIPSEDVTWSQRDRMGVPRSASAYPSEIPTLIKQGEYVVNANASRTHRDLLDQINTGKSPEMIARHKGGPALAGGMAAGGFGMMLAKATEIAMKIALQRAQEARGSAAFAGMGAKGEYMASPGKVAPQPGRTQIDRMWNTVHKAFPGAKLNDGYRPGANDMHGRGKAIDLGKAGVAGGKGNTYMAAINRWIADNFPGSYELIYDGIGDDRPDLKAGRPLTYNAATRAAHTNHVHWAMQAFHKGGLLEQNMPSLRSGGSVKYDNTMTNLHKGETVLTAPLTESLKGAIDSGLGSEYNVTIDLRGAYIHEDVDIEKAVDKAIEKRENKNGRKRVIK